MNQNWKDFLTGEQASFTNDNSIEFPPQTETTQNQIFAPAHFAILTVSGKDAAQFLQGQITCNINEVTKSKASFGAFCTAKGRAITTFLLIRLNDTTFALILPSALLETVTKKLQMYILRSDVTLTDSSDSFCLIGLCVSADYNDLELPTENFGTRTTDGYLVKLPSASPRFLMLTDHQSAIDQWSRLTGEDRFQPQDSARWRYLDILDGIPWLTPETTEEFIPQMLNLDKLGGVSFNKGCYTGQEIIARTHYLGTSKRELYLAESDTSPAPAPNTGIINPAGQPVGKVLQAETAIMGSKMLIVLPTELSASENLCLNNQARNAIKILRL
ncbi:MAG: CAF17-like 4Fe-4S cluster assembly/insertion protein YgfZ [Gammaproteobacteria bacterium]